MSLHDPNRGGRRNNEGPPDLDEILRQFNDRLTQLLGKNQNNQPPNQENPEPSHHGFNNQIKRGSISLILFVLLAVWVASGFYIVDTGQRGVVLRFGRYIETTQPGPRWHLPYPIETVELVNQEQVRTVELGYRNNVKSKVLKESLMLTDDENIIDLQFAIQYTLKSPEDYLFSNRSPDDTVLQAAETAVREIVGKNKMDFVLYEGREQIAVSAARLMQQILDRYKTGINISKVTMQNAQPPEQVQAAFDDAVKAGQDRERQKNEGQAYANDVVPKARGTASRLLQEADGYKQRVIATAEGDASRFNQIVLEYNKAPGVTRDRLYYDAMQQIYNNTTKVLVDQRAGNSLLYLPLDKILQQTGTAAPTNGTSPAPTNTTNGNTAASPATTNKLLEDINETLRTRDALRTREREAR